MLLIVVEAIFVKHWDNSVVNKGLVSKETVGCVGGEVNHKTLDLTTELIR